MDLRRVDWSDAQVFGCKQALKNVASPTAGLATGAPASNLLGFEEIASVAPLLAAAADED